MNKAPTDSNKYQQLACIDEVDQEAIRLRFEGYTYAKMRELLLELFGPDRTPTILTMRGWFYKHGRLYDFYNAYAKHETKTRRKEAMDILRAHLGNASRTLVGLMDPKTSDMVRLLASKEVINRLLGEPVKPIANLNTKDPATRILEDMGLLDKKNNDKIESGSSVGESEANHEVSGVQ